MHVALPLVLLVLANTFMTFAWYGHLGRLEGRPLWMIVLMSWGIAFFEYCLQVPANRMAYGTLSLGQLKVTQEVITMLVFMAFSTLWMRKPPSMDLLYATGCLALAAYFMFRGGLGESSG
jgi:uncharacterized protein